MIRMRMPAPRSFTLLGGIRTAAEGGHSTFFVLEDSGIDCCVLGETMCFSLFSIMLFLFLMY